jgi:hypothetical protein
MRGLTDDISYLARHIAKEVGTIVGRPPAVTQKPRACAVGLSVAPASGAQRDGRRASWGAVGSFVTLAWEAALKAIDASPELVNQAVPPYGTPLYVTVGHLALKFDGSTINDTREHDLMRVVRALYARGARFSPEERRDLRRPWLLTLALHEGPITTADENPLVWRILTRTRNGATLFSLRDEEGPLLNKRTALHGTPLYAALLQVAPDLYPTLIRAGARLSASEESNPAVAAAFARACAQGPELRCLLQKE